MPLEADNQVEAMSSGSSQVAEIPVSRSREGAEAQGQGWSYRWATIRRVLRYAYVFGVLPINLAGVVAFAAAGVILYVSKIEGWHFWLVLGVGAVTVAIVELREIRHMGENLRRLKVPASSISRASQSEGVSALDSRAAPAQVSVPTAKDAPGLELSFEWLRDVLPRQLAAGSEIDRKAATLFTLATGMFSLGIPLSLGAVALVGESAVSFQTWEWAAFAAAVASYLFAATVAVLGVLRARTWWTLDDPSEIRKWYWDYEPWKFREQILAHTECYHKKNADILRSKGQALSVLPFAVVAEAISLVVLFVVLVS